MTSCRKGFYFQIWKDSNQTRAYTYRVILKDISAKFNINTLIYVYVSWSYFRYLTLKPTFEHTEITVLTNKDTNFHSFSPYLPFTFNLRTWVLCVTLRLIKVNIYAKAFSNTSMRVKIRTLTYIPQLLVSCHQNRHVHCIATFQRLK